MQTLSRLKKTMVGSVVFLSAVMTVFRTFLIYKNIDKTPQVEEQYYFLEESPALTAFLVLVFVLGVLFAAAAFVLGNKKRYADYAEHEEESAPAVIFTSSLCGFLMLGTVFYYFFYCREPGEKASFMLWLILAFAFISGVYFIFCASGKNRQKTRALSAWMACAPIGFYVFRLLHTFVEQSTSHNASSVGYLLVSQITFVMFFLTEGKIKADIACPRTQEQLQHGEGKYSIVLYLLFGFLTVFLSWIYTIPELLLSSFWLLPYDYRLLFSAVDFIVVMYIITKLYRIRFE